MAEKHEPRRLTVSVEAAGKILGISRGSAYQAARNGELPGVLRIGGRYLVSVAALRKALHIDDQHDD
jgi:excisionase family DNA binding protein